MAIGINYQAGGPEPVLTTADEVAEFLPNLRDTADPPAVLCMVYMADDPIRQLLQVGIHGNRGWLSYGKGAEAWISHGSPDAEGEVAYAFQVSHTHHIPASVEIPFDAVVAGVQEFLATNGARPSNVEWVED